jgi:hypothetical protein
MIEKDWINWCNIDKNTYKSVIQGTLTACDRSVHTYYNDEYKYEDNYMYF